MNKEYLTTRDRKSLRAANNNILSVDSLTKHYKNFSLHNVSFQLPRGYIMGFIGPNGSGKSTTIKLIMNLLKRDSGRIKVFGLDNLEHETTIKNRIAFVYDENRYHDELSIEEMGKFVSSFYKNWEKSTFNRYLNDFNLNPKQRIKELSKGMKMKFSLAAALSHQAELLIMDEPTAGLDPLVRAELVDILQSLIQDEQKSIFFSTHITSDLDKIADFITFLHNGKVVLSAPKDDLLDKYGIIKGGNNLLTEETKPLFAGLKVNKFGFEGLVRDKKSAHRLFKEEAVIEKPSLEDIMLYTVKGEQHV